MSGGGYILCMVLKNFLFLIYIFVQFSFFVVFHSLGATPYIPHIGESHVSASEYID